MSFLHVPGVPGAVHREHGAGAVEHDVTQAMRPGGGFPARRSRREVDHRATTLEDATHALRGDRIETGALTPELVERYLVHFGPPLVTIGPMATIELERVEALELLGMTLAHLNVAESRIELSPRVALLLTIRDKFATALREEE